jgi:transglutaminase-like putative cysteine protease
MLEFDMLKIWPLCLLLPLLAGCIYTSPGPAQTDLPGFSPILPEPGATRSAEKGWSNPAAFSVQESKVYEITQHFRILNHGPGQPSRHNLWVALISNEEPYQKVVERSISSQNYTIFEDENGNQIAEFDLTGLAPGESLELDLRYQVQVNRLAYDLSSCLGDLPREHTSPELYIESNNPQILSLSRELSQAGETVCEQVRSFYDYVGDHLVYSFNGRDWGAQAALGEMGADCSEYASLMVALSRAAGVPSRYLEGILYLDPDSSELARTEHAWLEVYLPGIGWAPMDPTLGRSSIFREQYFAANSPDHIIVSRGRNPSALRGASYFTHIYWPGPSAVIKVEDFGWQIDPFE